MCIPQDISNSCIAEYRPGMAIGGEDINNTYIKTLTIKKKIFGMNIMIKA